MTAIRIEPACLRDASYVLANMRPLDAEEVLCQVPDTTHRHELAWFLIQGSAAFVAYCDDRPAMVYGTSPINVTCLSVWAIGTRKAKRCIAAVTRHLVHEHMPERYDEGFRSAEARSIATHHEAHRWMQSTGAVVHGPDFCYGKKGELFRLFRWTPEAFDKARRRYRRSP